MEFQNEFTVPAPLDATWITLLDLEQVATCLPGAAIERSGEDGVFRGAVRVKVGPVTMHYQGTVRLVDVDEDGRAATFEAHGNEAGGAGMAAAVIRTTLEPEGSGSKVSVDTELKVTGRAARFGRGIMEDVAGSMMGRFAGELEKLIAGGGAASTLASAAGGAVAPPTPTQPAAGPAQWASSGQQGASAGPPGAGAVLHVGDAVGQAIARRAAPAGAAAGVLALVALLFAVRRRKRPSVTLKVQM